MIMSRMKNLLETLEEKIGKALVGSARLLSSFQHFNHFAHAWPM